MKQPRLALSLRQPWAWLVVNGLKDVENRTWPTAYRGPLLIHAGMTPPSESMIADVNLCFDVGITREDLKLGGIVGEVELVNCVQRHRSKWFSGPFGFVLAKARVLPFKPMPGKLKFFHVG